MKKYISLLLVLILFTSCSRLTVRGRAVIRAEKLIEQGKYPEAVFKLEGVLKNNPDYEPAQLSFATAYTGAVLQTEMILDQAESEGEIENIATALEKLYLVKNAAATLSPGVKSMILINYPTQSELISLKENVAVSFYKTASELEGIELNRQQLKKRFYLYKKVLNYSPNYMDVKERYKVSKEEALQRVLIEVKPYRHNYIELGEFLKNNTVSKLHLNELSTLASSEEFKNYLNKIGTSIEKIEKSGTESKDILFRGNILVEIEIASLNYIESPKNVFSEEKFWIEKYDTETKLGKMVEEIETPEKSSVEYRTHKYRQYNYTKSNSLSLNINYKVVDLLNGEVIKAGKLSKLDSDAVSWKQYGSDKVFSFKKADLPPGVMNEYPKDLKSESKMVEETVDKLGKELGQMISKVLI